MRDDLRVQAALRIMCGEKAFGPGAAALLEGVRADGSLRRAAAGMQMSYNKAWHVVRGCEQALGFALLNRRIGGAQGGGATLTPQAEDLLARYRAFEAEANRMLDTLAHTYFDGME